MLCIIILTEKYSQPSHSDFIPRTKQKSTLNMKASQSSEHSGTKSNICLYSTVFLQLPNCSIGPWAMPRPTRLPQTHDHVALHPLIESNVRLTRATILELTPKLFQPFLCRPISAPFDGDDESSTLKTCTWSFCPIPNWTPVDLLLTRSGEARTHSLETRNWNTVTRKI